MTPKEDMAAEPDAGASEEAGPSAAPPERHVYCAVCTFPPEYCEFSASSSKCQAWLSSTHPELFSKIYSEEALTQKMANLTAKQAEDLEKDSAKKEKRAEAKAEKERKALAVRSAAADRRVTTEPC